ncbi:hypothetical protein SSX86_010528 [Deinandra increscens subsp. villosa]|uniref:Auxin-responsive protein n=1 Tax=Deinandra increscens subsp. villosa TaxID=3103831 RepID=A0AAP0DBX3_9ASTR
MTSSFEETELRLGLPGAGNKTAGEAGNANGKRGFDDTITDLNLKLSSDDHETTKNNDEENKVFSGVIGGGCSGNPSPAKAQVVGWPPVRSYRKNIQKKSGLLRRHEETTDLSPPSYAATGGGGGGVAFVKVSMDGAPYLRKVDLKMYKSYQELSDALGNMFNSFTIGSCGSQGLKDFMNESKLMDLLNSSDYVPTYEDKDGDWMLVGDVPWEMFVDSCKRLRIMKGKEAIGLAPRAMEKCKNRS